MQNKLFYHGSFQKMDEFYPLTHFGSAQAACHRLDDLFPDYARHPERKLENTRIYEVTLSIGNPLRVRDVWTDHPIGIAGETLFENFSQAKPHEISQVLEPEAYLSVPTRFGFPPLARTICQRLSVEDLEKEISHDKITNLPPTSHPMGYEYALRLYAVAARFVKLARQCGYDGLVYENDQEDRGEDCWVNFTSQQVHSTGRVFTYVDYEEREAELLIEQESLRRTGKSNYIHTARAMLKKVCL